MFYLIILIFILFLAWLFLKLFSQKKMKIISTVDQIFTNHSIVRFCKYFVTVSIIIYSLCFFYAMILYVEKPEIYNQIIRNESYEEYYNLKTSNWQDFKRMTIQFGNLVDFSFANYFEIGIRFFEINYNTSFSMSYNDMIRLGLSSRNQSLGNFINILLFSAFPFGKLLFWCVFIIPILYKLKLNRIIAFCLIKFKKYKFPILNINFRLDFFILLLILFVLFLLSID